MWRGLLIWIGGILLVGQPTMALAQATSKTSPPNLILLLADDLRHNALGCTSGGLIQTPNLDSLARRGLLFGQHFVTTSICCVSRASILSGQYARRHKINDFATSFTPAAFSQTYPGLLRTAGYRLGFIGKYGVGNKGMPTDQFAFWRGFPGQGNYFDKGDKRHSNQRLADQAVEFLKGCQRGQPFCLSVSFKAPHAQDRAPREFPPDPRDEKLYGDTTFPVPRTAAARFFQALPEFVQKSEGRTRWQRRFANPEMYQQTVRDYYRLVFGLDREIGRIIVALQELGMDDNTIIVFTADNGFFLGERGLAGKWLMYEESIRVPLIVVDPRLPAGQRGRQAEAMTLNIDLAPTLLDYAGIPVPKAMQGQSLRPWLRGESPAWRQDWFYEHLTLPKIIPPSEGVRTQRWAYLRWVGTEPAVEELYDVRADPLQEHNLAAQAEHQPTLRQLRARWRELRQQLE